VTTDHAHENDHGGNEAERGFWQQHGKSGEHVQGKVDGHAEGHGKVQKVVEKMRPGSETAREGGSMTG